MAPKFATDFYAETDDLQAGPLNITTLGTNEVIGALNSQDVIRVYRLLLIATAANNITITDGANNLCGSLSLAKGQGLALGFDTKPWFSTSPGNNLNITLSSATPLTGLLYFTGGTFVGGNPQDGLIAEDGVTFLVAEDGVTFLVRE